MISFITHLLTFLFGGVITIIVLLVCAVATESEEENRRRTSRAHGASLTRSARPDTDGASLSTNIPPTSVSAPEQSKTYH